jgi:hypothetical protein
MIEQKILFTKQIRPICMLSENDHAEVKDGVIVAWGKSENSTGHYERFPTKLELSVKSNENCYRDNIYLAKLLGTKAFTLVDRALATAAARWWSKVMISFILKDLCRRST